MATTFYLISLVMYIKFRLQNGKSNNQTSSPLPYRLSPFFSYVLSVLCAILAMKTKQIAFTLPLTMLIYEFFFFNEPLNSVHRTPKLKRLFYLTPIILTILIIPLSMLNIKEPIETIVQDIDTVSRTTPDISRTEYLLTQSRVIMTYLRLLVWPADQNLDYRYPVYHSFFTLHVFLSVLFILLMIGIAMYLLFRSRISVRGSHSPDSRFLSPNLRLISFAIIWFFLALSVESGVVPIRDVIVEHRLYLPSIGFFIGCVSLLDCMIRQQKVKIIVITIIVALLSVSTYERNTIWKDPQTLWEDVIDKAPENVRAYNELGAIFRDEEKYSAAMEQFEKTLQINSNYAFTYYNIGYIHYKLGDYENAVTYFKKALECELTSQLHMDIFNSIGIAYSESGKDEDAVAAFKRAVEVLPRSVIPYNNLGRQYMKMGKFDQAIETFKKGLRIREEPHLRSNLSLAFDKKKERDKHFKKID